MSIRALAEASGVSEKTVRLRINRTISSADGHAGDTVEFEVLDDISVNGTLVIPKTDSNHWPLAVGPMTYA